jgi:Ca2+/Na+ antiporter
VTDENHHDPELQSDAGAAVVGRYKLASRALAGGATAIVALALAGIVYPDPRNGQATIESDRRFYLLFFSCELHVLALALISLRYFKWAVGLGWAINLALALYLALILIWLEFFWHW